MVMTKMTKSDIDEMGKTMLRAAERVAYPPMLTDGTGRVTRVWPLVWPAYLLSAAAIAIALYALWG